MRPPPISSAAPPRWCGLDRSPGWRPELDAVAWTEALQALLPPGRAWPREPGAVLTQVLAGLAVEFGRIDGRTAAAIREAHPEAAAECLLDWEAEVGLPDACPAEQPVGTEARRRAVLQRLTARGGASPAYFLDLARALGYADVTLEEFRVRACGEIACGEDPLLVPWAIFCWRVTVPHARLDWARCGSAECGVDPQLSIGRAGDLECLLEKLKPAHTAVVVAYDGDDPEGGALLITSAGDLIVTADGSTIGVTTE